MAQGLPARSWPVAVSVGGLASSGGAGVSLDHLVGRLLRVHFYLVPSSIVAETGDRVEAVEPLGLDVFRRLLALHLPHARAVKASLLATPRHVEALAEQLPEHARLVLDPVHTAGTGDRLLAWDTASYLEALEEKLLPRATLVAANAPEAEALTGITVVDEETAAKAAQKLVEKGAKAAVVKGGHWGPRDRVADVYADHTGLVEVYRRPRIPGDCSDPHGGGCVFSATATALLALDATPREAAAAAGEAAWAAIHSSYRPSDAKRCTADPAAAIRRAAGILEAINHVREALKLIAANQDKVMDYIPETGMNIAEAPPDAEHPAHVAAVEGRVRRGVDRLVAGCVLPGASSHMARLVLALQNHGLPYRAAINIKPAKQVLEKAAKKGLKLLEIKREHEPEPGREGATMQWIARKIAENNGADIVYDHGAHGKEPMARILAENAVKAAQKLLELLQ